MIFCRRQSTGNKDEQSFNLNGEAVKVASQAIYLGFHLTSNGRWSNHISKMANRGKAAMATLFRNSNLTGIGDLKIHKNVFNSKIRPILHYGGEVWDIEVANSLETLQLQYYKRIKGDLGLFSMRKHRQIQLMKFWLKILQCPSSRLIRAAYDELLTLGQKSSWPFHVKKLLDSTGLSYAWNGGDGPISDQKAFLSEIQIRLEDQEIQKWWNDLSQSESLSFLL